jgi:hypothetical protein
MNIRCPKSETRVPVGYCERSCLNPCEKYLREHLREHLKQGREGASSPRGSIETQNEYPGKEEEV